MADMFTRVTYPLRGSNPDFEPVTRVKLINAPWCGDYDNAVKWDDKNAKRAWFNAQQGETREIGDAYRILFNDSLKLTIPINDAITFNYAWVQYPTNDATGRKDYFYFIDSAKQISNNTTEFKIRLDWWQTFIDDLEIPYCMLEQGHAPLKATSVETYLSNPAENNKNLLTPDFSIGSAQIVKESDAYIFNDTDMYACIATTANTGGDWGTREADTWNTPARDYTSAQGQPGSFVFAVPANGLESFIQNAQTTHPQFIQTIQGVFFVAHKMLDLGSTFNFCNTVCYRVNATQKQISMLHLEKSNFGYPSRYANIAKLYTFPYAHIEVADESGDSTVIRIEDTTGEIKLNACVSLAFPYVGIDAHLTGIGGGSKSLTFRNVDAHRFNFGGKWYETLKRWEIPVFAIIQSGDRRNDYATHYDRKQSDIAAENAHDSSYASANATVSNTAVQTAANAAMVARSNTASATDTYYSSAYGQALQAYNAGLTRQTTRLENEYNMTSAMASAAGGTVSQAIQGGMSGFQTAGPMGAIGGAIGGAIVGAANGAATVGAAQAAVNLSSDKAEALIANTQTIVTATWTNNSDKNENQVSVNTDNASTQNTANSTIAANTSNTAKANADRSLDTAQNAIANSVAQAGLSAPSVFGSFANGSTSTTKPQALFANVVTQPDGAICAAGDAMLRYGYKLNQQWSVATLNVMDKFTYWKIAELWCGGVGMIEQAQQELKKIFKNGVTVWRNPDDIGRTSLYDNGI